MRPILFLFAFFLLGAQPSFAGLKYAQTRLAHFYPPGHLVLDLGFQNYFSSGEFGDFQGRYYFIPLSLTYAVVKNVQLGVTIPVAGIYDAQFNRYQKFSFGDFQVDFEFGHDDYEYDFREAFTFSTRIGTGVPVNRERRLSTTPSFYKFTGQNPPDDLYPFVKNNADFSLGWNFSKELFQGTSVHFNFRYVYELGPDEGLTNIFAFNGLVDSTNDTSTVTNVDQFSGSTVSLFGIEKIIGRLFWTTGLDDPWKDKINDHLEFSTAVDTTFNLEYYLFGRRFSFVLKPFLEIFFSKRFTEESLYKSHLDLTVGIHLKLFSLLRYQIAFTHVLWSESRFEYQDAATMSLTLFF